MDFSIIISTYERCESLHRLLTGIAQHFATSLVDHEVIVANNARDPDHERSIRDIVAVFQREHGEKFRLIRAEDIGKCRAQNKAIPLARGKIIAFFDDDVQVSPHWLEIAAKFFRTKSFDAMQGPILMPTDIQDDIGVLRDQERYRTISFLQYPPGTSEINSLNGANMAVRREMFDRVGLFNESLGPGRSGMSEDVEFARRIIINGGKIGYEPGAGVFHEVDRCRLTEEFFRRRHEQQGRSRLLFKRQSLFSIVSNLLRSIFAFMYYSLFGNERKKYRAKGRYYHYRAMFLEKTYSSKTRSNPQ